MPDPTIDPNRHPHFWYINAVVDMLKMLDATPGQWGLSDSDPGNDGAQPTLSATLTWDDTFSPGLFPHGLAVFWDREDGWQYAAMYANGSNQVPRSLPVPLWAKPTDVAAVCLAILEGDDPGGDDHRVGQHARAGPSSTGGSRSRDRHRARIRPPPSI